MLSARELRRLAAEAQGVRQLAAEAWELRRLAAEAQGVRQLAAEAQGVRQLAAEAQGVRQLAAEAQGVRRLAAEAQGVRRLAAEAQGVRRLVVEAQGVRRLVAEAQGVRRLVAEAQACSGRWRRGLCSGRRRLGRLGRRRLLIFFFGLGLRDHDPRRRFRVRRLNQQHQSRNDCPSEQRSRDLHDGVSCLQGNHNARMSHASTAIPPTTRRTCASIRLLSPCDKTAARRLQERVHWGRGGCLRQRARLRRAGF